MRRMDKRKSIVTNGTSTLYLVILIGDLFTNVVTPKTLKSRVKLNSLSKVEPLVDKPYLAGYKNNSSMNSLSLISKTLHKPETFEQEAQSKMKITGHLLSKLSHSSKYNVKQIYDIHPTVVMYGSDTFPEDTDDSTSTGNYLFSSDQNLVTPLLESYWATDTLQTVGHDLERTKGYSKSYSTPMLYLKGSQPVDPVSTEHLSSLPSERFVSGQDDLFPLTETWSHSNKDNKRSSEDLKLIISTISLPTLSSLFESHPTLTYNTKSVFTPYSTVHTTASPKPVSDARERNPGGVLISRFIPRWLRFLNKHKNIYSSSNVYKHLVGKLQHALTDISEQSITSIGSELTKIPGSDTATLKSDFGILPSVSNVPSSDMYLNRVATPTLKTSARHITIAKTTQHQSTFDAHPFKTSEGIFSSTNLIDDNYQAQNYSSESRSQISVTTLPASSEQTITSSESKLTDTSGSDTATLNSDFGILPSVSNVPSSDMYLNRVTTPTLKTSAKHITIAKTTQHQSTFDAHPFKTSEGIFSSINLIEDNYQAQNYSSESRSQISVTTLPASGEQTITSIESKLTDNSRSDTATLNSDFGILPSVSNFHSSDMYLNRVATPALKTSANHITIAKAIQHQSTFDANSFEPSGGILSSKTLSEENFQEIKDSLWSRSQISVATAVQNNEISYKRIPTPRVAQINAENWTAVPPTVSDFRVIIDSNSESELISLNPSTLQNINNIDSSTESSEITKSFNIVTTPSLDSLSAVMPGLQPSYSQETNEVATGYDLPKDSQIESDISSRILILQNTVYSVADSYIRTFTTKSTPSDHLSTYTTPENTIMLSTRNPTSSYTHTTAEYSMLLSTEYTTSNKLLTTESVLLGTEQTTSGTASSVYSTDKALFSSDYQGTGSSIMLSATFASQSQIHATSQYSTNHFPKYNPDDVETTTIKQLATEETTDMKDIVVKTNGKEIKIEININNNIVNEDRKSTSTTTTTQKPPDMPLELLVVCAYMCQQRGSPIPPFCGCTLQAWLR